MRTCCTLLGFQLYVSYCHFSFTRRPSAHLTWNKIQLNKWFLQHSFYSVSDAHTSKKQNKWKRSIANDNFPWRNKCIGGSACWLQQFCLINTDACTKQWHSQECELGGLPSLSFPSPLPPVPLIRWSGGTTPEFFFEIKGARRWVLVHFGPQN